MISLLAVDEPFKILRNVKLFFLQY